MNQWEKQLAERDRRIAELMGTVRQLTQENRRLQQRVDELEAVLGKRQQRNDSQPPRFSGDYSLATQERKRSRKRNKKSPGRTPNADKLERVQRTEDVFPEGAKPENCVFCRDRLVWRLEANRAVYVRYRLHRERGTQHVARLPEVLPRGEYGLEIGIILSHLVYGLNLSIDQARELLRFFTRLELSGSQANSLLNQLARLWQPEFENLVELMARASVVYMDETGWKVSAKNCYAWVFTTLSHTVLLYGRGRDESVLEEILPADVFRGIGVSDDYAVYRRRFDQGQKCWAHLLRKAIKLMLSYPNQPRYREFFEELLALFREGKRIQKDGRLGEAGRRRRLAGLEERFQSLGIRYRLDQSALEEAGGEELRLLLNELVRCYAEDELFTFVLHPEVEATNNVSEQLMRGSAQSRKTARTSKTSRGATRRGILGSVLTSLKQNLSDVTLDSLLLEVSGWYQRGVSLFRHQLEELRAANPPPAAVMPAA
jgi:transposase